MEGKTPKARDIHQNERTSPKMGDLHHGKVSMTALRAIGRGFSAVFAERIQRDVASNTPYCCLKSTWCRLNFFVIINQINTLRRLRQLRQLRRLRRHVFPIYIKRVNDLNGDNHHADHPDNHNEHRYSWSFYPVGGERCTSGSSLWWSRVWLKWPHPTSFIEDNRKKSGKYLPE